MTWFVRGLGMLIVVLGAIVVWMSRTQTFDPTPRLPRGISSTILAIELVESADEARSVFRDPLGCRNREVMRGQIHEDWFFIAAYWATFCGMGVLLARRPLPGAWGLAALVLALTTGAAAFDIRENLGILRMTGTTPLKMTDAMAQATRHPSLLKWGLIFADSAVLSLLFLERRTWTTRTRVLGDLAALFFLSAALVGSFGLWSNPSIDRATMLLFLGLAIALCLFWGVPDAFLGRPDAARISQG